jgi:DNA-binding transcriptional LysR family regulator
MELVKSLVLDGVGVGILPRRVAAHGVTKGRLSSLEGTPYFDDTITLVRRYDLHQTRGARVLTQELEAHAQAMAGGRSERSKS